MNSGTELEPEVIEARRTVARRRKRLIVGLSVVAAVLVLAGSQAGRLTARPTEGVDLADPPRYDDVARLRPSRDGSYGMFGIRGPVFDLGRVVDNAERRGIELPRILDNRRVVFVTWPEGSEPPDHRLDAWSATLYLGDQAVLTWGHDSIVAVYAGPEGRQLVPISPRAIEGGAAVKLLPARPR